MKKIKRLLAVFCVAAVAAATAIGCGDGDGKEYENIKEYVEANPGELETAEKEAEGTGMTIKITTEGSALVYIIQYGTQLNYAPDEAKSLLEAGFEAQRSEFEETLEEMKKIISDENVSFVFRYLNADGTELFSGEVK